MTQTVCWLEYLKAFAPILGALVALFGAWLAYKYAVRKLKYENAAGIERSKYESILKAHEHCWSMLMFTTETENTKSLITWGRSKESNEDQYYFHPERCEIYFDALREMYYEEGNGLYLDQKVSNPLFEIRNIVYGLLLKNSGTNQEIIILTNPKLAKQVFALTEKCRVAIREAIELENRNLNLKYGKSSTFKTDK